MEGLGQNDRGDNIFHCPRCGTVKMDAFGQHGDKVYVPKLVERCREFEPMVYENSVGMIASWEHLGITESINLPKDRPT